MPVFMLPSAAGTCQVCATKHEATQPHNAQSLPYQMWFQSTYGRGATWADAVAHCPAEVSAAWKEQLLKIGKWSEPKSGSPISTVDESGGVPTPRPLSNMEPTVVDMRTNHLPNKRKPDGEFVKFSDFAEALKPSPCVRHGKYGQVCLVFENEFCGVSACKLARA